jgi:hypothetical protein
MSLAYVLGAIAFISVINWLMAPDSGKVVPFSEFKSLIKEGSIKRVELSENWFTGYAQPQSAPEKPIANPSARCLRPSRPGARFQSS